MSPSATESPTKPGDMLIATCWVALVAAFPVEGRRPTHATIVTHDAHVAAPILANRADFAQWSRWTLRLDAQGGVA